MDMVGSWDYRFFSTILENFSHWLHCELNSIFYPWLWRNFMRVDNWVSHRCWVLLWVLNTESNLVSREEDIVCLNEHCRCNRKIYFEHFCSSPNLGFLNCLLLTWIWAGLFSIYIHIFIYPFRFIWKISYNFHNVRNVNH